MLQNAFSVDHSQQAISPSTSLKSELEGRDERRENRAGAPCIARLQLQIRETTARLQPDAGASAGAADPVRLPRLPRANSFLPRPKSLLARLIEEGPKSPSEPYDRCSKSPPDPTSRTIDLPPLDPLEVPPPAPYLVRPAGPQLVLPADAPVHPVVDLPFHTGSWIFTSTSVVHGRLLFYTMLARQAAATKCSRCSGSRPLVDLRLLGSGMEIWLTRCGSMS
ncbi:uncharacterized protein LOC124690973 [Lolium rigidum]|uniref:uncharacterized protein LOC124690973 n=1 Tax=Lolium rigidum TaxID=89674 RepID=UPI001F5DBC1A|nr:uncharacterized protein LOC124690973 [Lolium rigidum]